MRETARFLVAFAGGAVATDRMIAAGRAWRLWHRWLRVDPSGADFYRTDFWVSTIEAALVIAAAALVFGLLRARSAAP
jgi:hypothetical protein